MSRFDVLTVRDAAAWQQALDACAPHDFYHLSDYHALAEQAGEGTARLFVHAEAGHTIALPLLLRPVDGAGALDATSVYGYPGPIAAPGPIPGDVAANFRRTLTARLDELGVVSVFSRLNPLLPQRDLLAGLGEFRVRSTVAIDLTASEEIQRAQMRASNRGRINQLRRLGFTCVHDREWNYFADFRRLYEETMHRLGAAPHYFFPTSYYDGLRSRLSEWLHLFVCLHQGAVVTAGLFLVCHGIVQYHLSGSAAETLALAPTNLLIDEVRLWAVSEGLRVLHLGGGTSDRADDSLLHFKRGFSRQMFEFATWRWIVRPESYRRLCEQKALRDERAGCLPVDPEFFPAYRCPTAPCVTSPTGADAPTTAVAGGNP